MPEKSQGMQPALHLAPFQRSRYRSPRTILVRAADCASSREICGEHYHADVEASHALGAALGILFLRSEALKPQIEPAKAELRPRLLTMD